MCLIFNCCCVESATKIGVNTAVAQIDSIRLDANRINIRAAMIQRNRPAPWNGPNWCRTENRNRHGQASTNNTRYDNGGHYAVNQLPVISVLSAANRSGHSLSECGLQTVELSGLQVCGGQVVRQAHVGDSIVRTLEERHEDQLDPIGAVFERLLADVAVGDVAEEDVRRAAEVCREHFVEL